MICNSNYGNVPPLSVYLKSGLLFYVALLVRKATW